MNVSGPLISPPHFEKHADLLIEPYHLMGFFAGKRRLLTRNLRAVFPLESKFFNFYFLR
jgi:hypothetical protein